MYKRFKREKDMSLFMQMRYSFFGYGMSIRKTQKRISGMPYHHDELACDVTPAPNGQPDDSGRDKILNGLIFFVLVNYGKVEKRKNKLACVQKRTISDLISKKKLFKSIV